MKVYLVILEDRHTDTKVQAFAAKESALARMAAALFLERMEGAGKFAGNGHHAAQRIAKFATGVLREGWTGEISPPEGG